MPSYNKVILAGHLTREPALKYLPNQTPLCEFGIAMNRKYKVGDEQREEVCFVDCAAFGKVGELIAQYCQKGKAVLIDGRLKFDSWEDKQTGNKRSKLSVVVDTVQFLSGGRDDAGEQEKSATAPATAPSRSGGKPTRTAPVSAPFGDEQQFQDSDIPFGWKPLTRWI